MRRIGIGERARLPSLARADGISVEMKLNHVNLTVFDALETRLFLEKYFGVRGQEGGNRGFQVLYDDNDLVLTLIKGRAEDVKYPPTFHIGFIQPSERQVDEINAAQGRWLRRAAAKPSARLVDVLFTAPGGFVIEVLG